MVYERFEKTTVKDQFQLYLLKKIFKGDYKEKQHIYSEREFARRHRLSKGTVHNVICTLARMGFVTVDQRHGVYINNYRRSCTFESLSAFINYPEKQPKYSPLYEIPKFINYLEGTAMRGFVRPKTNWEDMNILYRYAKPSNSYSYRETPEKCAKSLYFYHYTLLTEGGCGIIGLFLLNSFFAAVDVAEFCRFWGIKRVYVDLMTATEAMFEDDFVEAQWILTDGLDHFLRRRELSKEDLRRIEEEKVCAAEEMFRMSDSSQ